MKYTAIILMIALALSACTNQKKEQKMKSEIQKKVDEFSHFKLTTDLSVLTPSERKLLPYLFEAAQIMDEIFWAQTYGDKNQLQTYATDSAIQKFIDINYGPWERLNDNKSFVAGIGDRPAGATFYPIDMTKAEFEAWNDPDKKSLYTVITRDSAGALKAVPYHVFYKSQVDQAAALIRKAAGLADNAEFKRYLELRAEALLSDDYYESDIAWLEMKNSTLDFVVGPIESYEDQLFGYKTAYESYILVKDKEWSKRLERFAALLPQLQKQLPCDAAYKNETPGIDSDLNAYDAIYYAGDCNAGSKTIAINLPNDEKVRAEKGSRKLQLKNSMQAKFDKIVLPIAELVIDPEQRKHVKFDAFFENTMFHEVAHGLGLGKTVKGDQTVRDALKESYTSIEESKADILGLWCVVKLEEMGELKDKELMDNFVTFVAGIFRSVRFGAASAHGKANMICFNYFNEKGAFSRNPENGTYRIDFEKMKLAVIDLANQNLVLQGDGDYDTSVKLI
ncbi:MAG: Zn-dependent hydrolase, partial [Prolixibacteraceae bacterium]|nr:Zn-dependent hydrolase [Prolixibacteraceae bacterium]